MARDSRVSRDSQCMSHRDSGPAGDCLIGDLEVRGQGRGCSKPADNVHKDRVSIHLHGRNIQFLVKK